MQGAEALIDRLETASARNDQGRKLSNASERASEGGLLVRHRQGDPTAFAEFLDRYRAPVYSFLVRSGIRAEERDDLFQEIFLKIHRGADGYDVTRPLHPWVFTIVANSVRNHVRRRRVRELVFGATTTPTDHPDRRPDSEQVAEAKETATWLMTEIGTLPEKQRHVLLLASVENLSMKEVSQALDMPVNTVKTCLRRARLNLAKSLQERRRSSREENQ